MRSVIGVAGAELDLRVRIAGLHRHGPRVMDMDAGRALGMVEQHRVQVVDLPHLRGGQAVAPDLRLDHHDHARRPPGVDHRADIGERRRPAGRRARIILGDVVQPGMDIEQSRPGGDRGGQARQHLVGTVARLAETRPDHQPLPRQRIGPVERRGRGIAALAAVDIDRRRTAVAQCRDDMRQPPVGQDGQPGEAGRIGAADGAGTARHGQASAIRLVAVVPVARTYCARTAI